MKYFKILSFVFVLLFITANSFSQNRDSLLRLYNNQTIYRYGNNFMKGTERLNFYDLKNEFSFSPIGLDSYNMAKRYKTTAFVFQMLTLAASITTISLAAHDKRTGVYISMGGQIVFSLAGAQYTNLSNKQLDKALWQRNKDLLFGQ